MNNVYYDPEKFGLTPVDEIDLSSGSYEYDKIVVWKNADGKHFWARDAGCSCPIPFESYGIDTITPLANEHDFDSLRADLDEPSYREYVSVEEKANFLNTVRQSMGAV